MEDELDEDEEEEEVSVALSSADDDDEDEEDEMPEGRLEKPSSVRGLEQGGLGEVPTSEPSRAATRPRGASAKKKALGSGAAKKASAKKSPAKKAATKSSGSAA